MTFWKAPVAVECFAGPLDGQWVYWPDDQLDVCVCPANPFALRWLDGHVVRVETVHTVGWWAVDSTSDQPVHTYLRVPAGNGEEAFQYDGEE